MPVTIKDKETADNKTIFILRNNWFTLEQTDGEAQHVEPAPTWDKAKALAALDIVETPFDHLDGNTQGYARSRSVAVSPIAAMPWKTLIHEMAHVLLDHTVESAFFDENDLSKGIKEAEAESVAYLVIAALGLPGAEESRAYIQNWLCGNELPDKSAGKIFGTADKILKAGRVAE